MGRRVTAVMVVMVAALVAVPAAWARDAIVPSFDGTPIVVHFFPAEGLKEGQKAPTVLSGHGWGGSGSTNPDSGSSPAGTVGNGPLRKAGYNVLTWDARGFGGSGGTVTVDAPEFEARDVQALISWVATQPEALLDAPGDPRVGMVGGSYGGGIQLVTAGLPEPRLDAIVPDIAWHSLVTSLYKEQNVKGGWATLLYGAGVPTSLAPGLVSPAGVQTGSLDPHIHSAYAESQSTGGLSEENARWFDSRGPDELVENIRVPTLFTQGTIDTLFTLDEAITNYRILRRNGVPTKMIWHCGGHGTCTTPGGNGDSPLEQRVLAWLARYLKGDTTVDTGPRFEWVADDGKWRSASDFPIPAGASLRALTAAAAADGSGALALAPSAGTSGSPLAAAPASDGLDIPVRAPASEVHLVGYPRITLSYRGSGSQASAVMYAQIVDEVADVVLGNQVTPLRLQLDGAEHTLERDLEAIAAVATPQSRYVLQLIPSTQVYGQQRATANVEIVKATLHLPYVDPAAIGARDAAPVPGAQKPKVSVRVRGARAGTRRVRALVRTDRALRAVRIVLRDRRGRVLGRARVARVSGSRAVVLKLRRDLRPGRYRIELRWRGGALRSSVRVRQS